MFISHLPTVERQFEISGLKPSTAHSQAEPGMNGGNFMRCAVFPCTTGGLER
jgi:hypothetical protein